MLGGEDMGNVYNYTECDCGKLVNADYTFIVHGSNALTHLSEMQKENMSIGKIAAHFCGYCGGYVSLAESKCRCNNFRSQGWNYSEEDDRRW